MNILGIHDGHNATAAVMVDGKITAAVGEERMTYRKNDMGFPKLAISECLRLAGLEAPDIDVVAFSSMNLPLHYMRTKREFSFTIRDWLDEQELYWKPLLFENRINHQYFRDIIGKYSEPQAYRFNDVPLISPPEENAVHLEKIRKAALQEYFSISPEKVLACDHHTCHQYYAYFASPFRDKDALVFTSDGGGDGSNGTVAVVRNNAIQESVRNNCSDIARIYRYITLLLGMKIGEHEYKVMGLAPYASDYEIRKTDKVFKNIFHVPDRLLEYKNRPPDLFFHFRDQLADCRFDGIAGGVQNMVEEAGAEWFSRVTEKTGIQRVVFSGGLSMNVKLNKRICELDSVREFYCPASGGDDSVSIGACYQVHAAKGRGPLLSLEDGYLGTSPARSDVKAFLDSVDGCEIISGVDNRQVANLLAQNLVIGRMCGRMEFGARALGNRSILANPANPEIVGIINRKIKSRDFWMPFAPTVLDKAADRYLVNPKGIASDHMTQTYDATKEGKKALAAAIHPSDFTVRAQILKKANNPEYYDLIECFQDLTGIGAVLNTSFNLHGKPIVRTPSQALDVFENSDLDAMLLNDTLIIKKNVSFLGRSAP